MKVINNFNFDWNASITSGMIKQRFQWTLFFSKYSMKIVNLGLNFPAYITMDIICAEGIHNIFEFPYFQEEAFNFFRNIIEGVFY